VRQDLEKSEPDYRDVEMPRNSPTGFVCAFFATIMGFALIWHIWWMVIAGGIGAFATFVAFAWRDHDEYVIPAADVRRIDRVNREERRDLVSLAGRA
jgi:cytochrome o ubiquinol oxidase subunit 1